MNLIEILFNLQYVNKNDRLKWLMDLGVHQVIIDAIMHCYYEDPYSKDTLGWLGTLHNKYKILEERR
jgi:hypothetical protein